MLHNFFSISFRNLFKNKAFSLINISGLALGMAAAALIFMVINYQSSFDQFHIKKARIYEAWNKAPISGKMSAWNNTPQPLARAMEKDIPEVEYACRCDRSGSRLFSVGEKRLKATGAIVDSTFLKIFTFPMTAGVYDNALSSAYSMVVTEDFANKLFGTIDVIGKAVLLNNIDNFTITGVLKDLPVNSRFAFEYLIPWSYKEIKGNANETWGNNSTRTYVLLKENASLASANDKMKEIKPRYDKEAGKWEMFLYPLDRWRLYSKFTDGVEDGGMIDSLKIFGVIAFFLLFIACINFMNLSTARSEKRAKEVGIRKVVGAQRYSLISNFIGESMLLAFIAGILTLGLLYVSIPPFNQLISEKMSIDFNDPRFWLSGLGFIVITGIVAGSYPAFFMSSFNPSTVLKGTFKAANALITPRKLLVVLQFTFAIILIICTRLVQQQLDYAKDRESGYDREKLVYNSIEGDVSKNYDLIKNDLIASGVATSVTKSNGPITQGWSDSWGFKWEGSTSEDEKVDFDMFNVDQDIVKTAGLTLIEGRDFNRREFSTDSFGMIINESALKALKFKNPIGQIVQDGGNIKYHIIGVIKDFIIQSPYQPMHPMLITGVDNWYNIIHYKLNPSHSIADNMKKAELIFRKYNPEYPFDPKFIDDEYNNKFKAEQRMGTMAALFAGLTIFISCLGLFGLATYMAENRIKEIGVRKVLGASVTGITALLSKDFLKLVLYSFLLASPVAWWLMHQWLNQFPYRVNISWTVFALAGTMSLLISILTVSYQSIKAAVANPIKSLRTE